MRLCTWDLNYCRCLFGSLARGETAERKNIGDGAFVGCLVKSFYNVTAVSAAQAELTLFFFHFYIYIFGASKVIVVQYEIYRKKKGSIWW